MLFREVIAIYCENRQWRIRMPWPGLAEEHGMPPPSIHSKILRWIMQHCPR